MIPPNSADPPKEELFRKPYNHRYRGEDKASSQHKVWAKLIGEDRIAFLPEADRVVDVIFGLLARETGRIDYFAKELEGRQRPDQVKTVMKSLATVHAASTPASKRKRLPRGASKLHKPAKGAKKTKPLGVGRSCEGECYLYRREPKSRAW